MKKDEIRKVLERYPIGSTVSVESLKSFILESLENKIEKNINFYIYDLIYNNVMYPLYDKVYKISDRKDFEIDIPEYLKTSMIDIFSHYPNIVLIVWDSMVLNKLLNFHLAKNITFIEVENGFENLVFEDISKNTNLNILFKPTKEEINANRFRENIVILKTLKYKAPIRKKRDMSSLGRNLYYRKDISDVPIPKIEKILVDLFVDMELDFIDESEKMIIFKNALSDYKVNFKTLFAYARNRNKKDYFEDYVENILHFSIKNGEFYDK